MRWPGPGCLALVLAGHARAVLRRQHPEDLALNISEAAEEGLFLNASKAAEEGVPLNTSDAAKKGLPLDTSKAAEEGIHLDKDVEEDLLDKIPHFWPHARGSVGRYGATNLPGPSNFSASLDWSWSHPGGRYNTTIMGGGLIDNEMNIYIAAEDGIRKFRRNGTLVWYYKPVSEIDTVPSLSQYHLFGQTSDGHVFCLHLRSGQVLWDRKVADDLPYLEARFKITSGISYVEAHEGVVVTSVERSNKGLMGELKDGNNRVLGLDMKTGATLWEYRPISPVWNMMAVFPNDDTVLFKDFTGTVYRLGLHNGTKLWQARVTNAQNSFSDGGVILGPQGDVYACSNPLTSLGRENHTGILRRLNLQDGRLKWAKDLPYPCMTWPAVSRDGKTVVVASGPRMYLPKGAESVAWIDTDQEWIHNWAIGLGDGERDYWKLKPANGTLMAFDTRTGKQQWRHDVPSWHRLAAAGDEEGSLIRKSLGHRAACKPSHWTSPTITGDGTVLVGRATGLLYAYHPERGEVTYNTSAGAPPAGVSLAPGMMVYADCDHLHVFNTNFTSVNTTSR